MKKLVYYSCHFPSADTGRRDGYISGKLHGGMEEWRNEGTH